MYLLLVLIAAAVFFYMFPMLLLLTVGITVIVYILTTLDNPQAFLENIRFPSKRTLMRRARAQFKNK